jgi:HD-like signal output (HDOD) protein
MSITPENIFNELNEAIEKDTILLPSLPEVALKVRDVAEDEDTTPQQVVDILSQDASMSARLLQVVNSPLYPSRIVIDDLQMAVTRMGIRKVRDLVMNLAMKQMYQPTSEIMDHQFRKAWSTSVEVASICQMMAITVVKDIRKEQALLAGLIHNIGSLPILLIAENHDDLFQNEDALSSLVQSLQGRVGAMILKSWNFSPELIDVVTQCHNFKYDHTGEANLVDLVQFTLLQGGFVADEQAPDDWSVIPAFSKVGVDPEVDVVHVEDNQEMLDDARQSLMA